MYRVVCNRRYNDFCNKTWSSVKKKSLLDYFMDNLYKYSTEFLLDRNNFHRQIHL